MSTYSNKKQNVANQLKQFKNSLESIKSFLESKNEEEEVGCCECGSPACLWNKYDKLSSKSAYTHAFDNQPSWEEIDAPSTNKPEQAFSNIVFAPSTSTENTEAYLNGTKITGVSKASLEYDAELGVPVLKLEIIAPQIQGSQS